jgi:hypothetical protein
LMSKMKLKLIKIKFSLNINGSLLGLLNNFIT